MNVFSAEFSAITIRDLGKDLEWQGKSLLEAVRQQPPDTGEIAGRIVRVRKVLADAEKAAAALAVAIKPETVEAP